MPLFKIEHVPTGVSVSFDSFALTQYQDNVTTKYNEEQVFGRMDPIVTYQNTSRKVQISIRVQRPDKNIMSKLSAMQYPTYKESSNALSISRPPLVKVSLVDLLDKQLCAMHGFSFNPQTGFSAEDAPIIEHYDSNGVELLNGPIKFKSVVLNFDLTVLHETPPGWNDEGNTFSAWLGQDDFGPGNVK